MGKFCLLRLIVITHAMIFLSYKNFPFKLVLKLRKMFSYLLLQNEVSTVCSALSIKSCVNLELTHRRRFLKFSSHPSFSCLFPVYLHLLYLNRFCTGTTISMKLEKFFNETSGVRIKEKAKQDE